VLAWFLEAHSQLAAKVLKTIKNQSGYDLKILKTENFFHGKGLFFDGKLFFAHVDIHLF
jgi:hypothetical protein